MSMSDCEKCWSTPCCCGWEYRDHSKEERLELAAVVLGVSKDKLARLVRSEIPQAMPVYKLPVIKQMYCLGSIEIEAPNEEAAIDIFEARVGAGELVTTSISWDDPQYEEFSFGLDPEDDIEETI